MHNYLKFNAAFMIVVGIYKLIMIGIVFGRHCIKNKDGFEIEVLLVCLAIFGHRAKDLNYHSCL